MSDEKHDEGEAEKRGGVGVNLAALLALQDLKPQENLTGRMGEAQSTVNSGQKE